MSATTAAGRPSGGAATQPAPLTRLVRPLQPPVYAALVPHRLLGLRQLLVWTHVDDLPGVVLVGP